VLTFNLYAFFFRFGPGPHHVEINLQFDPAFPKAKDTDTDKGRMVVALAPVNEMPHTVYLFLEQVSHKLYDGTSFHRNAGHVMQGGPTPNFLSTPNARLQLRFEESGFKSVLFQEYSPNSPHEKYTLGMAGRPGGPDFYVSTKNNTDLHGPGGQTSYEDPSEADPCFAKIIEGTEFVDRMQLGPVKAGGYRALKDNVAITSMQILSATENERPAAVPEKKMDLPERDEIPDHNANDMPEGMKDE
jgi:cyclophilin family peptidyl-prolyl cis-trans isomerase